MIESILQYVAWAMLGVGAVFAVIGGIGVLRFPDFYTRMHAASVTDTMGAWLILGGLIFLAGWSLVSVKLAMILFFLFMTGPTATHALAKTAWYAGVKPLTADPPENSEGVPPSKP